MTMQLFDTMTGSIRPVEPREEGQISIYACGPTVYDHPHIGHARNALTYDILRRYLEWRGIDVRHVSNVTDIDDKIIERAAAEGIPEAEITATYEASYIKAMDALDVLHPHHRPHATDYVAEMVDFIEGLIKVDAAYLSENGVYLSVDAVDDYGALVHRTPAELREGAQSRVDADETKHDPLDFALWKAAKPGEPTWPSPWGPGRPGWHIECVAMALGILGADFDIHGGGDDLVFPHHENERAEAVAAGHAFARHWVHHAMVNVSGTKMSKSLGNFTTVVELLKAYDGRALRLLVLQTHYRKTMEVNDETMNQAVAALGRLDAMARRANAAGIDTANTTPSSQSRDAFIAAMDDDLATPEALAVVFETLRLANAALDANHADAPGLVAHVVELAGALGLRLGPAPTGADNDAEIEALVATRNAARAAKDFPAADRARDELADLGVAVEDTASGAVWHRI